MPAVPVVFHLDGRRKDIAAWRALRPDAHPEQLILGEDYWIALTHAHLRDAGLDVQLTGDVPDAGIVIFYAGDKSAPWRRARCGDATLFVAVRSDRSPVGFADIEIVQNAASADGVRAFHLPHWPQPGLRARDSARGQQVRTVLFPGTPQNLDEAFRSPRWQTFLAERGIAFRCHDPAAGSPQTWADLNDIDVLLAIRPQAMGLVRNKPAWKLFNAWLAGIPAILGPESGYRELRQGPLDYLEASNADEAMAAIDRLCREPTLYRDMVANGVRRGAEYTVAASVARWRALIDDVLRPRAEVQRLQPPGRWPRIGRELRARVLRLRGRR